METLTGEQAREDNEQAEPELTYFAGRLLTEKEALEVAGEASYEGMGV